MSSKLSSSMPQPMCRFHSSEPFRHLTWSGGDMEQTREHGSVLAAAEKRLLVRIARALPSWISSDQLTVLALAGMATAGAGYVLMRWDPRAVWIPVFGLLVNWFGDSLDGTVARVRGTE